MQSLCPRGRSERFLRAKNQSRGHAKNNYNVNRVFDNSVNILGESLMPYLPAGSGVHLVLPDELGAFEFPLALPVVPSFDDVLCGVPGLPDVPCWLLEL